MYTPKPTEINGRIYTVQKQWNAIEAANIWLALGEVAGPVLFPVFKAAIGAEEEDAATLFHALMGNDTAGGHMLSSVAQELRPIFPQVAPAIFEHVHCDRAKIGGSEVPAMLGGVGAAWVDHFVGRMALVDLWRVVWLALTANFEMPFAESPSNGNTP